MSDGEGDRRKWNLGEEGEMTSPREEEMEGVKS